MIWLSLALASVGDVKQGLGFVDDRAWGDAATALSRGLESDLSDKWKAKAYLGRARARTHIAMDATYNDEQARAALKDFREAKALGAKIGDLQEVEDLSTMLLHRAGQVDSSGERRLYADGAAFLTPSIDTLYAVCLHAEGLDDVVKTCSAVLDWPDADPALHKRPDAALRIAREHQAAGETDAALTSVDRGLTLWAVEKELARESKDVERLRAKGIELATTKARILSETDRREDLLAALEVVIGLDGKNPSALFTRARTLEELERYEEAEKGYQSILEHDPDHWDTHFALGAMFANRAIPLQKTEPEQMKALFAKARPHFERAAELKPTRSLLEALVQALGVLGDDEAKKKWSDALAELPPVQ